MPFDVLVVEDSAAMRSFIASTLEQIDGVTVSAAPSGFEALKQLPRKTYKLIITDINMPDINGLELIRFIRENEKYKKTPLIIISTESSQRDRERGLQLGANAYLVKPFAPDVLLTMAEQFLKSAE